MKELKTTQALQHILVLRAKNAYPLWAAFHIDPEKVEAKARITNWRSSTARDYILSSGKTERSRGCLRQPQSVLMFTVSLTSGKSFSWLPTWPSMLILPPRGPNRSGSPPPGVRHLCHGA